MGSPKVYTRTGDKGDTRLVGGRPERKDSLRVEAYGTVDELNATIGLAIQFAKGDPLEPLLRELQDDLFNLGTDLATRPEDRWEGMRRMEARDIERLEQHIDTISAELPPLRAFILPGGGPGGAALHLARTVCRRAERRVVSLVDAEPETGRHPLIYLNRLSDLLFVLARWAAKLHGEPETIWTNPAPRQ